MFFLSLPAQADSYSEFFIRITDAQLALKKNQTQDVLTLLEKFKQEFGALEESTSEKGQTVQQTLDKLLEKGAPTSEDLDQLSKDLLSFENEQNPVDIVAEKEKFQKKVYPALNRLKEVIASGHVQAMKTEYLAYNAVWTRNEAIVRSSKGGHYGKIETAMSFLRASIEAEPFSQESTQEQLGELSLALENFLAGKAMETSQQIGTLKEGISLLKQAQSAFEAQNLATGQRHIKTFIQNWTVFEGEVSTRSASLYNTVESQLPLIMAKGNETESQKKLSVLITKLEKLIEAGSYTFVDAMAILLREGVEALLIVLALLEILIASKQKKGRKYVYGGAAVGLLASILTALALYQLFPALSAGVHRETLEGIVGIFAVAMMIGIGIWLHSKSSIRAWNSYMEKKMHTVVSTGSFLSMFILSFLAVFREGAETILFYAGILPNIHLHDFFLGIALAIGMLVILAFLLTQTSRRIPVHLVFRILTLMIYGLAFKMLGVSIHALQLTGILSHRVLSGGASLPVLGIYPTVESTVIQLVFLAVIIGLTLWQKQKEARYG